MSVKADVFVCLKSGEELGCLLSSNILLYVLNILCISASFEILAKFIKQQEKLSADIATINVI